MSPRLILSVAALLAAAAPASAATTLKERSLTRASASAVGDDHTIAAWVGQRGVTALTRDGRQRTVAAPACPHLVAAGAKRLLFECDVPVGYPPPARQYMIVNPGTRARQSFALTNPFVGDPAGAEPRLTQLGAQWASGGISFHQATETAYYDWHTGRFRTGREDDFGEHAIVDLDRASLHRPLCAPFTREAITEEDSYTTMNAYRTPPQAAGRYVLTRGYRDGIWRLGRCGSRRTTSFGRFARLVNGWVIYDTRTTTYLRRLRDNRTFKLKKPGTLSVVGRRAVVARSTGLTLVTLPR